MNRQPARTPRTLSDLRPALLCALLLAAAVLATTPFLEMGVNDDWSYTRTAFDLARTDQLRYNGWATVMLGVQAYWAALFVKLFGASFTAVRLSTLPLAAGCAALLYALGRRSDLSPPLAALGALAVVLSPVFLPLAASFMTDVPGLFFLLLCVYAAARAAEATRPAGWLLLVAAAGVLGGTSRQTVWLAPLVFLPYVAWSRRGDARVLAAAAGLWVASLASTVACVAWFRAQPYALPEDLSGGLDVLLNGFPSSLVALLPLGFTLVLFALPVLLATLPMWRGGALPAGLIPRALSLAVWVATPFLLFGDLAFAPWMGNLVTAWGVLRPGEATIGSEPETLPFAVRLVLSVAVYALLSVLSLAATRAVLNRRRNGGEPSVAPPPRPTPLVVQLLVLYAALYVPLLAPRAAQGLAFDRYLLPVLPAVMILLLRRYQSRVGADAPAAGWALVALFGLYGVVTTHDYFAQSRARLAAARRLVAAGVPRTQITAGLEYDGETQVAARGHVNDRRIQVPPDAFREVGGRRFPVASPYFFWQWTPDIAFRYFVVLSPQKELSDTAFPPVEYTTWLPPGRRAARVQEYRPSDAVVQ